MGKVKIKTLGDEAAEQEALEKKKLKKEQKHAREKAVEPQAEVQPTVAEKIEAKKEESVRQAQDEAKPAKKDKFAKKSTKPTRSKAYAKLSEQVDRTKVYSLSDALTVLPKLSRGKFDETVELHINTIEAGISGSVTLPHGTGKNVRVAIADDKILGEIEKGKINFDILLAHPSMMPQLAKVAKVLGPKGLMPNPKNGTVTPTPEEAAKKYQSGLMSYKTESKSPIMHIAVGKVSFGDKKLEENIKVLMSSLPASKIRNVTLKSTMSPALKIIV